MYAKFAVTSMNPKKEILIPQLNPERLLIGCQTTGYARFAVRAKISLRKNKIIIEDSREANQSGESEYYFVNEEIRNEGYKQPGCKGDQRSH